MEASNEKVKADVKIFDAVANVKYFVIATAVIFVASLIVTLIAGLEVAVEFKGGTMLTYGYHAGSDVDLDKIKNIVAESSATGVVNVTRGTAFGTDLETVTVSFTNRSQGAEAVDASAPDYVQSVTEKLTAAFPDAGLDLLNSQNVNPSAGTMFFLKCLVAVVLSFILLIIYIAIQFRKIGGAPAGAFALLAIFHDQLWVYATFAFFRLPIDANFIAVALTILGYSINNTIVVYDRIRENKGLHPKMGRREMVNISIHQSLTMTVFTTISTVLALVVICIVAVICGVNSIISFALPMVVGMAVGFVSSLYIAGPLWTIWEEHRAVPHVRKKA